MRVPSKKKPVFTPSLCENIYKYAKLSIHLRDCVITLLPNFLLSVFLINLCIASPAASGQRALILPDPTIVHESDSKSIATASPGNHPAVPFNPSDTSGHLYWTNTTFKPTETVSSHEMTISLHSTFQGTASSTHNLHPAPDDSPSSFVSSAPISFSNHSGSSASLPSETLSPPMTSSPVSGSSPSDMAAAVSVSVNPPVQQASIRVDTPPPPQQGRKVRRRLRQQSLMARSLSAPPPPTTTTPSTKTPYALAQQP